MRISHTGEQADSVLDAYLLATDRVPEVRTVLVTTRTLSPDLVSLKNLLGVEVMCTLRPEEVPHKDAKGSI